MSPKCIRYMVVLALALFVTAAMTPAFGQQNNTKSTVIGTDHDIAGAGCAGCHVPHQASARGQTLLWARAFSTTIFGVYDTGTMDSKATEIGSAAYSDTNPPSGAKQRSVLCMSCHDGVTSPTVIGPTDGKAVGNPANSAGLTNDHPINMAFDPTADPGLTAIASVEATNVRLYDEGGAKLVECSSCHDVHRGPGIGEFLRVSNASSGLCTTCHL